MSRRREVQRRLATLGEIRGIMVAMKNLALMETRTLKGFLGAQERAVASIESAAADFLAFYGQALRAPQELRQRYVLLGSEQGFCGDFNESLVQALGQPPFREMEAADLVVVGRRLAAKLEGDPRVAAFLEGASVAEEVQPALMRLSTRLQELQAARGADSAFALSALYHCEATGGIRLRRLLPLPDLPPPSGKFSHAPDLNLAPFDFFSQLDEQYLYAVLHQVFYSSLMAENRQRLQHMDQAIHRLEEDSGGLKLKYNALRQEEIIEEIEVILLSAELLAAGEGVKPRFLS